MSMLPPGSPSGGETVSTSDAHESGEKDVLDDKSSLKSDGASPKSHSGHESVLPELTSSSEYHRPGASGSSQTIPKSPASPRSPVSRSKTLPRGATFAEVFRRRSALDGLVLEPAKIALVRRWIVALAIVDFDLEDGPVLSGCFPELWLNNEEAQNIAFSSFPDSSQIEEGSQAHSFRIRERATADDLLLHRTDRPPSLDGYLYGYAYFIQRKDRSIRRGHHQFSLVILTHLQYPALFTRLSLDLGSMYQTHGLPTLEATFQNISNWPDPTPGNTVGLGFHGSALEVVLPLSVDDQQLAETALYKQEDSTSHVHILAVLTPVIPPPLLLLEASISHLWSIWECLVLCEPIIIVGSSPTFTSQIVWFFRDLVRPIPLAHDFRPYFTVYDQDYVVLVNKSPPKPGLLIGVTNPLVQRACSHWPHVLTLGRHSKQSKGAKGPMAKAKLLKPGWITKTHNRYISKDSQLLKQLEDACTADRHGQTEASLALRRHFSARTLALLVPLQRYLHTLLPSPAESAAARAAGTLAALRLRPFNSAHFLASLAGAGVPLPFRSAGRRREFYERWLMSPAFGAWLREQEEVVRKVMQENTARPDT